MTFRKFVQGVQGIGLVEVMMAIAISGGLALTIAKLIDNTTQNTKQTEAKAEGINLKGIVQSILSNPAACSYTFSPLITQTNLSTLSSGPNNSITVPSIKDRVNAIAYSTASDNISPLRITSIVLTNYNTGTSTGDLVIQTTFNRTAGVTQLVKPIRIPLNFNIDNSTPSSPVLNGCSTMAIGGEWMLGGNAGTNPASDYVGTSDNQPLIFRVNAQQAGRLSSTGTTFLGYQAGSSNTATENTGVGHRALFSNTSGNRNIAVGPFTLEANTTGSWNYALGFEALKSNTTGTDNIAIGFNTLFSNTTGTTNYAIGMHALRYNTTGQSNFAIGRSALLNNTTGQRNISIGYGAMGMNVTGDDNVALGHGAGGSSAPSGSTGSGTRNTSVGSSVMQNILSGTENTAMGYRALLANSASSYNSAFGANALFGILGDGNVGVGSNAGNNYTNATNNTFLGAETGTNAIAATGSRNVFIGYNAGSALAAAASDKLHINNGVSTTPLIEGDFSAADRYIKLDANTMVGVGNTNNNNSKSSMAVGSTNTIGSNGTSAFAAGVSNTANGWGAVALGVGNNAAVDKTAAIGWNNTVSAYNSYALGAANQVTADYAIAIGVDGRANHQGSVVISDYGSAGAASWGNNTFTARFVGGYRLHTDSSGNAGLQLASGGSSWGSISDRNAKENFVLLDPEEHLRKIARLPVFKWNYIGQEHVKHMGPMAQDFYYIFRLGDGNDKVITTQDMEGVTIVAVKALEERTRKLQNENQDLKKRIEKLESIILKLDRTPSGK